MSDLDGSLAEMFAQGAVDLLQVQKKIEAAVTAVARVNGMFESDAPLRFERAAVALIRAIDRQVDSFCSHGDDVSALVSEMLNQEV